MVTIATKTANDAHTEAERTRFSLTGDPMIPSDNGLIGELHNSLNELSKLTTGNLNRIEKKLDDFVTQQAENWKHRRTILAMWGGTIITALTGLGIWIITHIHP